MITRLEISRFKSIRELALDCRKVNVFIGPPDAGKTNILDALQLLSRLGWGLPIDGSLRLRDTFHALFFRQFLNAPIKLGLTVPSRAHADLDLLLTGPNQLRWERGGQSGVLGLGGAVRLEGLDWIRFYGYQGSEHWKYTTGLHLGSQVVSPPDAANLTYVTRHNEKAYEFLKECVSTLDWKIRFDQVTSSFRLSEVRDDEILDYNLDLISDSLKRFFFYGAILLTSTEATLVFDEPDVYAFPPYPKLLGDMIAEDQSNQFFLTTHNPYFLLALAEKTPIDQLALFICSRDADAGTQAKMLSPEQVAEVVEEGADVFFNLDRFLGS